jgi:hypothetical protein
MIKLLIQMLQVMWPIFKPHLSHMRICQKGKFAFTIDRSAHKFKGVVESNAIIQDDIVKTIPHVLHVLKLKFFYN